MELRASLPPNVTLLGWVSRERLAELYARNSGFIHIGEEDYGITMIEAMASGTPVIALNRGGARDIVRDGKNGLLVAQPEVREVRDAVTRMAGEQWNAAALGETRRNLHENASSNGCASSWLPSAAAVEATPRRGRLDLRRLIDLLVASDGMACSVLRSAQELVDADTERRRRGLCPPTDSRKAWDNLMALDAFEQFGFEDPVVDLGCRNGILLTWLHQKGYSGAVTSRRPCQRSSVPSSDGTRLPSSRERSCSRGTARG